ncbi:MAG: HAD family phosphatase [Ileibacterium sp.]|nr:HAD family phosphatase [Ileibacterium sp.]
MDQKYVIFDMDGTLVDSMPVWNQLGYEYLTKHGVMDSYEAIRQETDALTLSEAIFLYAERFGFDPSKAGSEMTDMMKVHYGTDIPVKPGIPALLEDLKRKGVRMCVASASSEDLILTCLNHLNLSDYFEFVLSCETLETQKREPKIYLEAARRFQADPKDIAVYEDSLAAVQTAKKAGFYTVGVFSKEEEDHQKLIKQTADEYIDVD